jgi:hypothetical protein
MKIGRHIFLWCVVLSKVVSGFATNAEAVQPSSRQVFTLESIKGLGSCKSELSIRAEHRDSNGITLWLRVRNSSSTICRLTVNQDSTSFQYYSLSGENFSAAHRFKKWAALTSNTIVVPRQFMASGRVFAIRLTFNQSERALISPLLSMESERGNCKPLVRQIRSAEMEVRRCSEDADCSLDTIPFGCGCHYDKPLKKGAITEPFYTAVAFASKFGCSVEEVTSCDCREVSEVICRKGVCDWR